METQMMRIDFSQDQIELIKSQIARDCNDNELKLFLYQCKRTGLDPLTRQIYAIKRSGRMTIQTSIDGFRVIAERSGTYAGQDEPIWLDNDNGWPIKCTVKVYRFAPDGQRYCAGVGVAFFNEYYPNPINLQRSMPHTMIAKVAEALALRKAFPQDLSGLYTNDEMQQADTVTTPVNDVEMITDEQAITILELVETARLEHNQKEDIKWNVSSNQLTKEQAKKYIIRLNDLQPVDDIDSGKNYNQTDISKKIAKIK